MKTSNRYLLFLLCVMLCLFSVAKQASANAGSCFAITDTTQPKPNFSPRKATIRSAIIPGWGQIYNKKYWKLPLVYGALGTTAGIFFYNLKTYRELRDAYRYISDNDLTNDNLIVERFRLLSPTAIRSYRNSFRQNVDYSVLFFLIFWGLNVVDATVDAHLKAFDVSDNLSIQIKPGYNLNARTAGISLIIPLGKKNSAR